MDRRAAFADLSTSLRGAVVNALMSPFAPSPADDAAYRRSSADPVRDAYTLASSKYPRAQESSAPCAVPRHFRPCVSRSYVAACVETPVARLPTTTLAPSPKRSAGSIGPRHVPRRAKDRSSLTRAPDGLG